MISRIVRTARVLALACSVVSCAPLAPAVLASPAAPTASPFPAATATVAQAAGVIYSQPPNPAGGLIPSSLRDPDGSATDQKAWDAFTLTSIQDITEIRWSGGHDPAKSGSGGPVANFTVSIYGSIPAGTQPDLARPPLVRHEVGGNAGEAPGPVLGGIQMYSYAFVLPAPFHAVAGTKYWVQIVAYQPGPSPDWGLTRGTGGDGHYFRFVAGEGLYQTLTGDTAFSVLAEPVNGYKLCLPQIAR